jgi:CubicO group peptidase (beta-lactamase class C family)
VEEGRLSLDDRIGRFRPGSPDADATIREVLTHTSGSPDSAVYQYRPERFDALSVAVRNCTTDSYRETLANLFDRLAMTDSVPGADVLGLVPPAEGVLTSEFDRYARTLSRLAVPYSVDAQRKAAPSQYSATTLKTWTGALSTIQDLAKFDMALKDGLLLQPETLERAWLPPLGIDGQRTPHGIGWFVQSYNGERVVWQFGNGENGSSSLMVTLPARNLTLLLLANSTGLTKSFSLGGGDLTVSPFGRLFLGTFTR